ncbi:MAG TPA: class I SAM-dependent methyltransferase [Bryobacteraceae bacterium]|nr:class I SAM-dependent methyltransferase [Bryobacteraceae bacterium]
MQSNWQETFFRGDALEAWRRAVNPEMTRADVDFLERTLGAVSAAQLLDVPCGNDRHAIELAKRGYNMTGLDLSEEFIAEARAATPLSIRWVQADMRSLPWVSEFDGAYCFGNSFAYFNWEEARQFLAAVTRALKPGARFAVDTGMAAESILPSLLRTRWHRLGDMFMLSENRYDPTESRLDIDYTFIRDGRVETRPTSSYTYTTGELCRMHRDAGLEPVELFGSTDAEPYQLGSPRLILVSAKQ